MTRLLARILAAAALVAVAPSLAFAHAGGDHVHGFALGIAHPLGGLDHLLAMVAVGLVAARLGGRWTVLVPAAFVSAMALGGALGMAGQALPSVEAAIAVSLVVFGALALAGAALPASAVAALAALAGLAHGSAHGAELDATGSALGYAAGFLIATAALHGLGVAAALRVKSALVRAAGAGVTAYGAVLLAGLA
jgi:urease accessory protein